MKAMSHYMNRWFFSPLSCTISYPLQLMDRVRDSMVSSAPFGTPLTSPSTIKSSCNNVRNLPKSRNSFQQFGPTNRNPELVSSSSKNLHLSSSYSPELLTATNLVQKSIVPLAASIAVLLCSSRANAGLLSGLPGIESVPGPELPKVEFLSEFNEKNQKFYAENDKRFQESPLLKQLLERSKLNKEKNKQAILDKYCIRGAEWGVGDCSAEGMSPQDREEFIAALKKKAGIE